MTHFAVRLVPDGTVIVYWQGVGEEGNEAAVLDRHSIGANALTVILAGVFAGQR